MGGNNTATVRDLIQLRKFILDDSSSKNIALNAIADNLESLNSHVKYMSQYKNERECSQGEGDWVEPRSPLPEEGAMREDNRQEEKRIGEKGREKKGREC